MADKNENQNIISVLENGAVKEELESLLDEPEFINDLVGIISDYFSDEGIIGDKYSLDKARACFAMHNHRSANSALGYTIAHFLTSIITYGIDGRHASIDLDYFWRNALETATDLYS